jgi:ATP-dependent Lhr-like helicase
MLSILASTENFDFLDHVSAIELHNLRSEFTMFPLKNMETDRPILIEEKKLTLFTFTSSRINRTLNLLFNINNIECFFDEKKSAFEIECSKDELLSQWDSILFELGNFDEHLHSLLTERPSLMDFSKWGIYLPSKYQIALLKAKRFDVSGTIRFIETVNFISAPSSH